MIDAPAAGETRFQNDSVIVDADDGPAAIICASVSASGFRGSFQWRRHRGDKRQAVLRLIDEKHRIFDGMARHQILMTGSWRRPGEAAEMRWKRVASKQISSRQLALSRYGNRDSMAARRAHGRCA